MAGPNLYVMHQVRAHADPGTEAYIKKIYNVYVFKRTVAGGSPSKSQNQTAFKTTILTPLQACLSVSYITDWLDTRFLDDPLDPYLTTALSLNGSVAGDSLPSVNNALVHLKTSFRGLSNRGAKKYGPIAESDTTLDALKPAILSGPWATFLTALVGGYTDAGGFIWQPFIVSQKNSRFSPTVATVVGNLVASATVNSTLITLKRRKQPAA